LKQEIEHSMAERHQESLELSNTSNGIIPFVEHEVGEYTERVKDFRKGSLNEAPFQSFRLHQGVYGQRQPDAQMFRIKAPGGILTDKALEAIGEVIDKFAPFKKGHITTRENIQLHHLKLEDCADAMRILGKAGLSTREACANTVRNVVAPPSAGVSKDELFNVIPYMTAYVRYAVRHPLTQNFPRKFKTSFTGSPKKDDIMSAIHDLAFIAQIKDGEKGFKVLVGGGTSIMPRLAQTLYDFVSINDYLRVSEAIWQVFNQAETLRKNRMMARIKVLIDRIGLEEFRKLVENELANISEVDATPLLATDNIYKETPPLSTKPRRTLKKLPRAFSDWTINNVESQKQDGYKIVYLTVPQGDLTKDQFFHLAKICRIYSTGAVRTTQEQSIALRWVPESLLLDLWEDLVDIGLGQPDAHTISDVVSCPGTDSCKLGITSSMGLGKALRENIIENDTKDPMAKKLHVKISGCPNGCGQHHLANIGFHGAAVKGPKGQIPAYEVFLGGEYGTVSAEKTKYGQRIPRIKVPAKRVPELVSALTNFYSENRRDKEEFNDFLERMGTETISNIVKHHSEIPPNGAATNLYMDWEKTMLYRLERGEGECAI